ncbi:MAG: hypothetical protein LBJ20_00825 [Candidatus Methanoplasma sp.]|jgi:hypothetical protein|nr:hypothetical protein [Candidatus Methanoplasma sp.]
MSAGDGFYLDGYVLYLAAGRDVWSVDDSLQSIDDPLSRDEYLLEKAKKISKQEADRKLRDWAEDLATEIYFDLLNMYDEYGEASE